MTRDRRPSRFAGQFIKDELVHVGAGLARAPAQNLGNVTQTAKSLGISGSNEYMSKSDESGPARRRIFILFWFAFYIAWYWIAPTLMEMRGRTEEAGWLPMWMNLTMIGVLTGAWALIQPRRWPIVLFAAATAVHVAVGLGLHPR